MILASSVAVDILNDLLMYESINADLLKLEFEEISAKVRYTKIFYLV